MGWVKQEYEDRSSFRRADETESAREQVFEGAELQRWQELLRALKTDVDEYNAQGGAATLTQVSDTAVEITDRDSALTLTVRADIEGHTIHYDYGSTSSRIASPEGGIFAIRRSRWGRPELYSADQRIHNEGARRLLLEPILFPPDLAA
jgi:hypothetical protein